MSEVVVAMVTAPSEEVARSIARTLVNERLIACANLVPGIRSIYRWKDEVADEPEVLMLLKFASPRFEAVRARVVALHPYEVPEILRLDVIEGHRAYIDWVLGS